MGEFQGVGVEVVVAACASVLVKSAGGCLLLFRALVCTRTSGRGIAGGGSFPFG